jgi:hypothetical protein
VGQIVRVLRNPSGGWSVQREGDAGAVSHHATQNEAIAEGRRIARGDSSKLIIHKVDGQIRDLYSYGHPHRRYTGW